VFFYSRQITTVVHVLSLVQVSTDISINQLFWETWASPYWRKDPRVGKIMLTVAAGGMLSTMMHL